MTEYTSPTTGPDFRIEKTTGRIIITFRNADHIKEWITNCDQRVGGVKAELDADNYKLKLLETAVT